MSAKIVLSRSKPGDGDINQNDLRRIIQDYENFAKIESAVERKFEKVKSISIPKLVLKSLVDQALDSEFINVKFGITLPDQKSCIDKKIDISNHLTIVMLIEEANGVIKDQENDSVIVVGFKSKIIPQGIDKFCCGDPNKPGGL